MGIGGGIGNTREAVQSHKLDTSIKISKEKQSGIKKLLLLGAGESGKSTLFKQCRTLYGTGFTEEERQEFFTVIYNNLITSIKTLIRYADDHQDQIELQVTEGRRQSKLYCQQLTGYEESISAETAYHIKALWEDPGIRTCYSLRHNFQLDDSTRYFMGRIDLISKPSYIPNIQDVLRARVRTTGIVERRFVITGCTFELVDVGGQRNERKKWIHLFENVTAVLFVAAVSEYDQSLYEDHDINRLHEAIALFDEIVNSKWFQNSAIILFLNKVDLFDEKIQKVPLTICFPDYRYSPHDRDKGLRFIRKVFLNTNRYKDKIVYPHVTCATDSRNISHVFNAVTDTIVRSSLHTSGFL